MPARLRDRLGGFEGADLQADVFRFEAIGEGARQMIGARLVREQHHDDQVLGAFVLARGKPAISVHSVSLHDEPVASVTS